MATDRNGEILTSWQIMEVAFEVSIQHMERIAVDYMGFKDGDLKDLLKENEQDMESYKRAIIRRWANMNSEQQVKVRFLGNIFWYVNVGKMGCIKDFLLGTPPSYDVNRTIGFHAYIPKASDTCDFHETLDSVPFLDLQSCALPAQLPVNLSQQYTDY